MATASQQPELKSSSLATLSPLLDIFSKTIAGTAIALYASGFLIISLHHSRYGFTETNPFRARILAAGAWFFFLTAIPALTATAYADGKKLTWASFGQFLYPYYFACTVSSYLTQFFFNLPEGSAVNLDKKAWLKICLSLVLLGLLVFLGQSKKVPAIVSTSASVVFAIYFVQATARELFESEHFSSGSVALWFFGVGVVVLLENNRYKQSLAEGAWSKTAFTLLAILFIFARFYYPQIKSAWGGGTPVPVTIYFSKDSALKPNQSVSVYLVDESETGFYIVGQNEKVAVFVPRNAISLVYFSGQLSNSKLLP